MTTDRILDAIKSLITDADAVTFDLLEGLPIYTSQEDSVREYPCVFVTDQGAEEHETLRGVFDPLSVDVALHTIKSEDEYDGTTQEQHAAMVVQLYDLLGDVAAINTLNSTAGLKVFDIRTDGQSNSDEDGRNVSTINQSIVCCLDN